MPESSIENSILYGAGNRERVVYLKINIKRYKNEIFIIEMKIKFVKFPLDENTCYFYSRTAVKSN